MIASIAGTFSPQATGDSSTSSSSSSQATSNMFLQLLVAELKNQDPSNPVDGTQFVTQLAQMQELEQSESSGTDISAIRTDLDKLVSSLTGSES